MNGGAWEQQLLGYQQLILFTGMTPAPAMESVDFQVLNDWPSVFMCEGNDHKQGLLAAGDNVGQLIAESGSGLANVFGSQVLCDDYRESGCGPSGPADESECVRLEPAGGAPYPPLADLDVAGNGCPEARAFDVIGTANGGVGNLAYGDYDRTPPVATNYAQVIRARDYPANAERYRAVVDGYSFGSLSTRDAGQECVEDDAHGVPAIAAEIHAALRWTFGGDANIPLYRDVPLCLVDVGDGPLPSSPGVTQLFENRPNPFNPRTSIRFALGAAENATLAIYDVGGRAVKTLVSGPISAGEHSVIWDGTDDHGRPLGAGVYWSQLRAGGHESERKMILIK